MSLSSDEEFIMLAILIRRRKWHVRPVNRTREADGVYISVVNLAFSGPGKSGVAAFMSNA